MKLLNKLTIKTKLLIISLNFMLVILMISLTSYFHVKNIYSFQHLSTQFKRLKINILELRRVEKEFLLQYRNDDVFFEKGENWHLENFQKFSDKTKNLIKKINENSLLEKYSLNKKVKIISTEFENYNEIFKTLIENVKFCGNDKTGLKGQVNRAVIFTDSLLESSRFSELKETFLYLKKLQNEYLLQKNLALFDEFNKNVEVAKRSLFISNITDQYLTYEKIKILESLENYRSLFQKYVFKEVEIGLTSQSGLRFKLENSVNKTEEKVDEIVLLIENEEQKGASMTIIFLWITIVLIAAAAATIDILVYRTINVPLAKLKSFISELSEGKLPLEVQIHTQDESADMSKLLIHLAENTKEKSKFVKEIGKRNWQATFSLLSEEDELGNALLEMQTNLQSIENEENERKQRDTIQNWLTTGLTEFAEILHTNTNNLENLSFEVLHHLIDYLKANQGGFFILNDDKKNDVHLQLMAAFAYDRQKFLRKKIVAGEGLIGSCMIEKSTIYLVDLPDEFAKISSGLGFAKPKSLLIVPILFNKEVYGVIELASLREFLSHEREFVEKLARDVASTLAYVKNNIKTANELQKAKTETNEFYAQQESLLQEVNKILEEKEKTKFLLEEFNLFFSAIRKNSMFIEYDANGKVKDVNEHFSQACNISIGQMIGINHSHIFDIKNIEDEDYAAFWNRLHNGETIKKMSFLPPYDIAISELYIPLADQEGVIKKIYCIAERIHT